MKYGFGLVLTGVLAGFVLLIGCGSSPRVRDASQPYPADSEYAKFSPKNPVDEAEFAKTATASDSPVLQAIFQQTKPRFTLRKSTSCCSSSRQSTRPVTGGPRGSNSKTLNSNRLTVRNCTLGSALVRTQGRACCFCMVMRAISPIAPSS